MRAPFVATFTVLAGSSIAACHAAAENGSPTQTPTDGASETTTNDAPNAEAADAGDSGDDVDAPACPAERPPIASPCSLPRTVQCTYPDICPQAPKAGSVDVFTCLSGYWTPDADAYMLDCPTPPPTPHAECLCAAHQLYEGCVNLHCIDGEPSGWVVCDDTTKQWQQQPLPCNPPSPDAASDGAIDGPIDGAIDGASDADAPETTSDSGSKDAESG